MGAWGGFIEVLCCILATQSKDLLTDCELPDGLGKQVGIWNWIIISAGAASMHMLFAPYVHLQFWRHMMAETKEVDDPRKAASDRTLEARRQGGKVQASRHDMYEAFKDTFKGDPIIYFYILVLIASGVWSILGLVWICMGGPDCYPRHWTYRAAICGVFFFGFVISYSIAWYIYMHTMDMEDTITLRTGEQSTYSHPEQAAKLTQHAEDEVKPPGPFSCCMGGGGQHGESTQAIVSQQKKPDPPRRQRSMVCAMPKLGACLLLDALGDATYCAPGVGELGDIVFGPASAVMIKMMFNRNGIAALGCVEEVLPFTDAMPTATFAWFLENVMPNSFFTKMFHLQPAWAQPAQ